MNSYLEGWEVILIVINGVVDCKNMSKRSATNWSAILHSVTFSTQHSLMWIALQSSTPKYPGILECSTQGVALRNALGTWTMLWRNLEKFHAAGFRHDTQVWIVWNRTRATHLQVVLTEAELRNQISTK